MVQMKIGQDQIQFFKSNQSRRNHGDVIYFWKLHLLTLETFFLLLLARYCFDTLDTLAQRGNFMVQSARSSVF